jgi:hypothetical protein
MSRQFEEDQAYKDKSIFAYQMDTTQWVNDNECSLTNPTFLAYIPTGVLPHSIEVEDELRNQTRLSSKCPDRMYSGNPNLASDGLSSKIQNYFPHQRKECPPGYSIIKEYTNQDNNRSRVTTELSSLQSNGGYADFVASDIQKK